MLDHTLDDLHFDNVDDHGRDRFSSDSDDSEFFTDIPEKLNDWATSFKISLYALTALLKILHVVLPYLPEDAEHCWALQR